MHHALHLMILAAIGLQLLQRWLCASRAASF
jgi:hypothetical protein